MPAQPPVGSPLAVFAECADWLMIIGGTAMQSYGMDRMTYDSDCAILDRDEPRLRTALSQLGYVRDYHRPTFTRYIHLGRQRPVVDAMRLDAGTFSKLWAESCLVEMTGWKVRVPAPLHLVAMKLHALKQQPDREYKDWPDICHLLETDRGVWTHEQLKALVDRYGSDDVGERLKQRGLL